jgi:hypothetical protein
MIIKNNIMEDNNPNCEWRWLTLKKKSDSLQEAKDWLNENIEVIFNTFNIYQGEEII